MPNSLWDKFPLKTSHLWLNILLLFVPIAIVLDLLHASPLTIFITSALAIAPLASVLGESTGMLAGYCGPAIGGILSASLGNATEMIIAFFALRAGHVDVVKASLSGSIIGNLLLVLGLSMVVGGSRYDVQKFPRSAYGMNSTMLVIAVAALVMPAVFNLSIFGTLKHRDPTLEHISIWTSGVLVLLYLLNMLYVFRTHRSALQQEFQSGKEIPHASLAQILIALASATVLIAVMSEILVDQISPVTKALGMTELFVGVIVVALVGNAAENSTAIMMARRNKIELSIALATGASTQIALFVAPVLVFLSMIIGHPMTLVFNGFEIAAIILSVVIVERISTDGESNWFEGAQLLAVYAIVAVAFYFVPE